jgi:hypothetical protein
MPTNTNAEIASIEETLSNVEVMPNANFFFLNVR